MKLQNNTKEKILKENRVSDNEKQNIITKPSIKEEYQTMPKEQKGYRYCSEK